MRLHILWAISLLLPVLSAGQELIIQSIDALEGIRSQAIVQSSSGELLIIDDERLYRFDGYSLSVLADFTGRKGQLSSILKSDSKIFIGDSKGTLFVLENDLLDSIQVGATGRIEKMMLRSENELLILIKGEGLYLLDLTDEGTEPLRRYNGLERVNDIMANGTIYFATDHGLFSESGNKAQPIRVDGIGDRIITNVIEGNSGEVWSSDFYGSISCYTGPSDNLMTITLGDRIKITDLQFSNDCLYASTNQGVFQVAKAPSGRLISKQVARGQTSSLLVDDEANLWIVKDEGIEFASMLFFRFSPPINEEVHSQAIFNGGLILGTESRLLDWDYQSNELVVMEKALNVTCMDASESILAVGTYDSGLHIYSPPKSRAAVLNTSKGLADNTILAVEVIDDETIIVSTLAGINQVVKDKGEWFIKKGFEGLEKFYILSVMADSNGRLWFGTDNKGVVMAEDDRIVRIDRTVNGDETGSISSICEMGDRTIWMLSEKLGVLKWSDDSLESVESPHGVWGKYTSLIALRRDRLLLIGEKEVSILDTKKNEMLEFSDDIKLERGRSFFNNYAKTDNGVFFEHGGDLYGFYDDRGKNRTHSITHLTKVEVDLIRIDTTKHDFQEEDNNFQFTYGGILYRDPKKVQYSYRLLGFDEDWRPSSDRQAAYSHLPPGKFEFQVRSSHDASQTDAEVISYGFEIHKRFYNQSWFRILLIAATLFLIYWLSNRRRKAKELADRLTLLSTETKLLNLKSQLNPHFLFNSFNTVIGLIEEDKERSISFVEKLTDFFRSILEIGEAELIGIDTELKLLRDYIHLMTERFGNGLVVHIPEEMSPSLVPPMSLQLLVENAVKHNIIKENEPLTVSIEETEDFIIVSNPYRPRTSIKDSMGIGLENLQERYLILAKREIIIERTENDFRVYLPKIKDLTNTNEQE